MDATSPSYDHSQLGRHLRDTSGKTGASPNALRLNFSRKCTPQNRVKNNPPSCTDQFASSKPSLRHDEMFLPPSTAEYRLGRNEYQQVQERHCLLPHSTAFPPNSTTSSETAQCDGETRARACAHRPRKRGQPVSTGHLLQPETSCPNATRQNLPARIRWPVPKKLHF